VRLASNSGWLSSVPGYANSITYHPNGMVHQVAHTNGVTYTQANDPDSMRRPASYATSGVLPSTDNWTSGSYADDGAGNVTAIGSNTYTYDQVSRLLSATQYTGTLAGTGSPKTQTATYDLYGNVTALTTEGALLTLGTSTATNRLSTAGYDAAGSMTSWNLNAYAYEPLGMSRQVSSSGVEYDHVYTADDERLWTYSPGNPSRFTVRDLDGKVLREFKLDGATWSVERDYVYRDGVLLAGVLPTGAVNHFHPDHLGSPRLVTNASKAKVAYHLYHPYGAEATAFNQDTERLKFTGHERDLGLASSPADDLDYMHARYCSPLLGRFLSADPVLGRPETPQSWNRYTYVVNNPLKYVDPTGEAMTGGQIADELEGGIDRLEGNLSSQLPANATGILLDTLFGAGADFSRGLADVLRLGEASGTAIGEGAGAGETALAIGGDVLRAAAVAAPLAGAGRAAAGRTAITVVHYTDDAGRQAIAQAGNVRAGTFVTKPRDVQGMTTRQIEQRLEIQPGRGSHSFTVRTQRRNLVVPDNGRRTSGGAFQRQLRNPCAITGGSCG